MDAISINALTKTFRTKRLQKVQALKGVTFQVACGEVFGFLGPNGAGKSTTIKILLGLIRPNSGTARIMEKNSLEVSSRANVGYLPENPAFFDYLSAEEYLRFVGKQYGLPDDLIRSRSGDVLKRLDLWEARARPIRGYSKGMVQRLGFAQTLIHDPDVYVLDEPMSGLDPLGRALFKDIIQELKQNGKTVFFSTHITSDVETVCDRVGIIMNGELKTTALVDHIMKEGILGYHVQSRRPGDTTVRETSVEKEQLPHLLDELRTSGEEIVLIEPKRKSMEDFFLSIVRGTDE
jgi:ABC-2 type transport system ATP-binding protein